MQVNITFTGPPGAGKTVIATALVQLLELHGFDCTHDKGGNPRGPEYDLVKVQTTPELLAPFAN